MTTYKNFASAHWRKLIAGVAAGVLLTGCAMTPNGRGGVLVGLDTAELFGTPISTFRLRDGTEGTLRKDPQGKYSIKLSQAFRVVPLANAITARVARVENVGERTVVIVETQERGCAYRYEVLAFQGTDVLQWTVGNCKDRPRVELAADGEVAEYRLPQLQPPVAHDLHGQPPAQRQRGRAARRRYARPAVCRRRLARHGSCHRHHAGGNDSGRVIPAPPAAAPAPAATPKTGSRASAKPRRQEPAARAATSAVLSQPAQRAAAAAPAAPMIFQAEEIKPVVIDLRK